MYGNKYITFSFDEAILGVVIPVECEAAHEVIHLADDWPSGEETADALDHVSGRLDHQGVQRSWIVLCFCGGLTCYISLGTTQGY